MSKEIDIKLLSRADLVGIRETSEALAKMAKVSTKANASMSNAERRQAAEWMSVRSASERATAHVFELSSCEREIQRLMAD